MKRQRGAALMVILLIVGTVASFFLIRTLNGAHSDQDTLTTKSLAQAKEALIGFASTYGDSHTSSVNGYLLLPDMGTSRSNNIAPSEGVTATNFATNVLNLSASGRLPWKTLGLSPLTDGKGECLWYAISGSYQDALKGKFMNWDTLGQFDTFTSNGTAAGTASSIGTNYHQRPVAAVFAPGASLAGQVRTRSTTDTITECGGNYDVKNYLDTFTPTPLLNNVVNYMTGQNNATGTYALATPKPLVLGEVSDANRNILVNDKILTITPDDIFKSIKKNPAFKTWVEIELLKNATNSLDTLAQPVTIDFTNPTPTETTGGTVVGSLEIGRVPAAALTSSPLKKWQDNLLYGKCTVGNCLTVNGANCSGILIFPGERTATQTRATSVQKNTWGNYLEGPVLTAFTTGATTFTGASAYATAAPSVDVLACVKPAPAGMTQASFAADFGSFIAQGTGVTLDAAEQTVTIAPAVPTPLNPNPPSVNGCFWSASANPISLKGKTLRSYYEFNFTTADTFALTNAGADRGNGFTLQIVAGRFGISPNTCGTVSTMGALNATDAWGFNSVIFETDVYRDSARGDPAGNHSAILLDGQLDHAPVAPSATISSACNGTETGCHYAQNNMFEESPVPLSHNQRVEIHTGCNASCSACSPASHTTPNTYAKISAWIDCKNCKNVAADLTGPELITNLPNRDFSSAGNWSGLGTSWGLLAGALTHTPGTGSVTLPNSALANSWVNGTAYQVTFFVNTTAPGTVVLSLGGTTAPAISLPVEVSTPYSVWINAVSPGALTITPSATWTGSIDNVSITAATTPTMSRCTPLSSTMDQIYFGFTGGFRSGANSQGVILTNAALRSQ